MSAAGGRKKPVKVAKSSASARAMASWLSSSKKAGANGNLETNARNEGAMDEDIERPVNPAEEPQAEPKAIAKKVTAPRRSRRGSKASSFQDADHMLDEHSQTSVSQDSTAVPKESIPSERDDTGMPSASSNSMDGIEDFDEPIKGLDYADEVLARAANKEGDTSIASRTRNVVYRPIAVLDEQTSQIMAKYTSLEQQEEDDLLLASVLGITSTKPAGAKKNTGGVAGKKGARKVAKMENEAILGPAEASDTGPDIMDKILAANQRDVEYQERLQQTLETIKTKEERQKNGMDAEPVRRRNRFEAGLNGPDDDDWTHSNTHLLSYFAPSVIPQVLPQLKPLALNYTPASSAFPSQAASSSQSMAISGQSEDNKHQAIFDKLCSQPNAILKLPLLRKYLLRLPCPLNVAEWLIDIICFCKQKETALEAYDALLSLLPVPASGFPSLFDKNGHSASTTQLPQNGSRNGMPFKWTIDRIEQRFIAFGSGAKAEVILTKDTESMVDHPADPDALIDPDIMEDPAKLIRHLDKQARKETVFQATVKAAEANEEALLAHVNYNFPSLNFSLFAIFFAACVRTDCVALSPQELITTIVSFYRAIVDPSCQPIVVDLQSTLSELLALLVRSTPEDEFPATVYDLCDALWTCLEEPRIDFHATHFMWAYLTPTTTSTERIIRATLAYFILHRQIAPKDITLDRPPQHDPSYKTGSHLVTLEQVIHLMGTITLPKELQLRNYEVNAHWVLLLDIASSVWSAAQILDIKKSLQQLDSAFHSLYSLVKDKGLSDLKLMRFKDLSVHSFTKIRVLRNAVSADPYAAFRPPGNKQGQATHPAAGQASSQPTTSASQDSKKGKTRSGAKK